MTDLVIHRDVLDSLHGLSEIAADTLEDREFAAVLVARRDEDVARALLLPRQTVSHTHFAVAPADLASVLVQAAALGYPRLVSMAHSHVGMSVRPSGTDHCDLEGMVRLVPPRPAMETVSTRRLRTRRRRNLARFVSLDGTLEVEVPNARQTAAAVVRRAAPVATTVCSLVFNRRREVAVLRACLQRCPCCGAETVVIDEVQNRVVDGGPSSVPGRAEAAEQLRTLVSFDPPDGSGRRAGPWFLNPR